MALAIKMKRRGYWPGLDDPFRQALIDIEANAASAVDALVFGTRKAWSVVPIVGDYRAQLWECVVVRGACSIVLPAPTLGNAGSEVAVLKEGSWTITISAAEGLVSGATSQTGPVAYRARIFISSGQGWYQVG